MTIKISVLFPLQTEVIRELLRYLKTICRTVSVSVEFSQGYSEVYCHFDAVVDQMMMDFFQAVCRIANKALSDEYYGGKKP